MLIDSDLNVINTIPSLLMYSMLASIEYITSLFVYRNLASGTSGTPPTQTS